MARQLVPVVTCDHCSAGLDPLVRTSEISIIIEGSRQTYQAELCDVGILKLEESIRQLQLDFGFRNGIETPAPRDKRRKPVERDSTGRRVRKPMSQDDPNLHEELRTCTLCGTVSKTRQALGAHLKTKHDSTLSKGANPLPNGRRFSR